VAYYCKLLSNYKLRILLLHCITYVHMRDVCRSRIRIEPSTTDSTLLQLILLSVLDHGRDSNVSGKGTVQMQLLFRVSLCHICHIFRCYT